MQKSAVLALPFISIYSIYYPTIIASPISPPPLPPHYFLPLPVKNAPTTVTLIIIVTIIFYPSLQPLTLPPPLSIPLQLFYYY